MKFYLKQKKRVGLWISFKNVSTEFLRKKRNKVMKIWSMRRFQVLSAKMFTEMHLLNSHFEYFPENCGDYSEEEGERFCCMTFA